MPRSVFTPAYHALLEVLILARREGGLTQEALAKRLGKPQSFVAKVERGERRLDVIEFCAVARAMDMKPDVLFDALIQKLPEELAI